MPEPTHEERVEQAVEMFAADPFVRDLVVLFDAEFDSVEVTDESATVADSKPDHKM